MAEHRERVDLRMSREVVRRVIVPLCMDLGARYLVKPYLGRYDDDDKTIKWGLGHKRHGDKRHRTHATFSGIVYRDGDRTEGATRSIEVDRRIGWSRKHDNRLVANDETVNEKIASFNETFNKLRTFTSLDLIQRFSASAKGEVLGIGGSVTSSTEARAHTEVETEKFARNKQEKVVEDNVRIAYPGPILYNEDVYDDNGSIINRKDTIAEPGNVWLIERPVATLHTITPITQHGLWDCAELVLDLENWTGERAGSVVPGGEHWNVLRFAGLHDLAAFMRRDLVLRFKWSNRLRLSDEGKRALRWLEDESNRRVGPVEWERITVNENVSALEPSIITPEV